MKCFVCNQDSIKICNEPPVCIKCDICGLSIRCGKIVNYYVIYFYIMRV